MAANTNPKPGAASQTIDVLMEISRLLNTGLDEETMAICLRLCESGVNPEALAEVIRELRRETANIKVADLTAASGDINTGRG
ncbi:hypothetical protein BsWGS_19015 [Bradybaena similaris]